MVKELWINLPTIADLKYLANYLFVNIEVLRIIDDGDKYTLIKSYYLEEKERVKTEVKNINDIIEWDWLSKYDPLVLRSIKIDEILEDLRHSEDGTKIVIYDWLDRINLPVDSKPKFSLPPKEREALRELFRNKAIEKFKTKVEW